MIDYLLLRPKIGKRDDFKTMTNNKMIVIMIPCNFVLLRHTPTGLKPEDEHIELVSC